MSVHRETQSQALCGSRVSPGLRGCPVQATALQEWDNSTPPVADQGDARGEEEYQPDESLMQTEREEESSFGIAESSGAREQVSMPLICLLPDRCLSGSTGLCTRRGKVSRSSRC